jgi:NAD/NADP transhydrogenase alpha subunit
VTRGPGRGAALVLDVVGKLTDAGYEVVVEAGVGRHAFRHGALPNARSSSSVRRRERIRNLTP